MGGGPGFRTVAYYVNWAIYARKHRPQDLPVEKLTHILYAFANIRDTGEVHLTDTWADTDIHWEGDSWNDDGTNIYGCLKQLNLLKRRNRNLKVLLSIGGWTYSSNFRGPASTPQGRATFARSCVDLLKNLGFDGIDIDWEYPQNANEARDYVELLAAVRAELDAYARTLSNPNHHFELTVACAAGPSNFQKMDIRGMDRYLDFWNLMAYDYAGKWDNVAGHQSNLFPSRDNPSSTPFSTHVALQHYTQQGVHPNKIVIGMPLYGHGFENTDGPGRPYQGVPQGSWEQGIYDYKALPVAGAQEQCDDACGASYCYNPQTRTMVTYDTPRIAWTKANFIKQNGFGGAMWWESSGDKEGPDSLISVVVNTLGGPAALQREDNCIEYPATKYDNLRNGFPNN